MITMQKKREKFSNTGRKKVSLLARHNLQGVTGPHHLPTLFHPLTVYSHHEDWKGTWPAINFWPWIPTKLIPVLAQRAE